MAQAAARQPVLHDAPRPRLELRRGFGGGPTPPARQAPAVSSQELAIVILVIFETMVFSGLIATYLVLRTSSFTWPPADMPRLPIEVTWVNTAILLFSAFTMFRAVRDIAAGEAERFRNALALTATLGTVFLIVQGSEWVRLVHQGLTLTSGSYGGTFYTIIGFHALHVVGAVVWLAAVFLAAWRGRYSPQEYTGVRMCAIYWFFVCALWPVLFGIVYLY
jgi:heme/copper-type cytochrome/quinol oxidase subunit 3